MYQSLDLFRIAGDMARHAGARQAVVARNIANADTPGYQAQAVPPFADVYREAQGSGWQVSRPGHLSSSGPSTGGRYRSEPSPNGNSVSLEMEMTHAAEVEREHTRAIAVYRHAMGVIRTVLSGR